MSNDKTFGAFILAMGILLLMLSVVYTFFTSLSAPVVSGVMMLSGFTFVGLGAFAQIDRY